MEGRRISSLDLAEDAKSKVLGLMGPLIRDHISILCLLAAYVLFVYILEIILAKHPSLNWDWGEFNCFTLLVISLFLIIQISTRLSCLKARDMAGLVTIWSEIRKEYLNLERFTGFLLVYLSIPIFIIYFSKFKQLLPEINPFRWDEIFMKIDYVFHLGHHPWALLQPLLVYPDITWSIDILYMLWFPIMFAILLWMAWSTQRRLRLQFFLSFMALWIILGTVLAACFSSAGPCYFEEVTGLKSPYVDLLAYLKQVNQVHYLFALSNQKGLWDAYRQGAYLTFGGISAMPSMHVAGSTLFAILGWKAGPFLGRGLTAYALITQIGSVLLGWHYAIDGYFAILLTFMVWKIADLALSFFGWKPSERD
jgi:hypothetical protein